MSDEAPFTAIKQLPPVRALGRQLVSLLNRREERTGRPTRQPQRGVWALGGAQLFDGSAKSGLEELVASAERRRLSRRSSLLLEEQDTRVWVIVSGGIKLCRTSALGGRLVEAILAPGDIFGRLSTGGAPTALEVESLEASELAGLARDAFSTLLREHPELALSVLQEVEDRQQRLVRRLESLVFKDVRARVAETLLELAKENHGPCQHGFAVDVRINQQDLAELVGATRQMVNRVLGELSRELYVQRVGKVICVLHLERLERLTSAGTETPE
ncbi:MAG: Crp/Fnr family transcriptional regulator [Polyangiaceae bacterium]|nr:Crp/Fnr family transcriptional regulator [Polyangiaceae bacterium]MCB9610002.1 Crp/Fnr family transcriptional regulator [Polyangiaceae bacterium]